MVSLQFTVERKIALIVSFKRISLFLRMGNQQSLMHIMGLIGYHSYSFLNK